jgi:hypothetical protein
MPNVLDPNVVYKRADISKPVATDDDLPRPEQKNSFEQLAPISALYKFFMPD